MPMKEPDVVSGNTEVLIRYSDERVEVTFKLDGELYGNLTAERNKSVIKDRYKNVYEVTWSQANDGYGPFIYDVAMEFVTKQGGSLTSDKTTSISRDALSVWKHYLSCRGGDVRSYLLYHPDLKMNDDARDYHYRKSDGVWLDKLEENGQLRIEKLEVSEMCFPATCLSLEIDDMDDDEFCDELNERFGDNVFKLNMFDKPNNHVLYDGGRGRSRPGYEDVLFELKRLTGEDD